MSSLARTGYCFRLCQSKDDRPKDFHVRKDTRTQVHLMPTPVQQKSLWMCALNAVGFSAHRVFVGTRTHRTDKTWWLVRRSLKSCRAADPVSSRYFVCSECEATRRTIHCCRYTRMARYMRCCVKKYLSPCKNLPLFRQFKGCLRRGGFVQTRFWSAALGTLYFFSVSNSIHFGFDFT